MEAQFRDFIKLIRKSQYRRVVQAVEKLRNSQKLNQKSDHLCLRMLCYCLNAILLQYLERRESMYKNTAQLVHRKLRMYLGQWYVQLKTNSRLKPFLFELMKYLQMQALRYRQDQQTQLSVACISYCNDINISIWSFSSRDTWTPVIQALLCLDHQQYQSAELHLDNAIQLIIRNIDHIKQFKLVKQLPEQALNTQILKQLKMVHHIFYLCLLSFLYNDNWPRLQELIKISIKLTHNYTHVKKEQLILMDNIISLKEPLSQYMNTQSEINRVLKLLFNPKQEEFLTVNPIDNYFYQKYKVEDINRVAVVRVPSRPSRTIRKPVPVLNTSPRLQTHVSSTYQNKILKKESFSYITTEQNSQYFINRKISDVLRKESFFSYLEVTKDEKERTSERISSIPEFKHRSVSMLKHTTPDTITKNKVYNIIEKKALQLLEIQQANHHIEKIKDKKDHQQKINLSDKLLAQVESTEQQIFQPMKYQDIINNIKTLADSYSQSEKKFHRPKTQQSRLQERRKELASSVLKN